MNQGSLLIGLLAVTAAYLLGSIPFSFYIGRMMRGIDVRRVGSGNVGATNVTRAAGKLAGLFALTLDVGKGAAAVLLARAAGLSLEVQGAAAAAAVAGHVFPAFLRLRGGKGVATAAGALAPLAPLATGLAVAAFVLVVAWTRFVALGSMVVAVLFTPLLYLVGRLGWGPTQPGLLVASGGIGSLILIRHAGNLRRLWRGSEQSIDNPLLPTAGDRTVTGGETGRRGDTIGPVDGLDGLDGVDGVDGVDDERGGR